MSQSKLLSTLVLKQSRLKNWVHYVWIPFFLTWVVLMTKILPFLISRPTPIGILILLSMLIFAVLALHNTILFLPGQGDLILTPEGFQLRMPLKQDRKSYRWDQISNFYVKSIKVSKDFQQRVCFDVLKEDEKSEREYLSLDYDLSLNALETLLNDWKQEYESRVSHEGA